jgi:hypothetical protein
MNRDRFARLREVLARVTELAKEERAAYLKEACGEDTALYKEAEAILAREGDGPSFLGTDGGSSDRTVEGQTLSSDFVDDRARQGPMQIGPYVLRERIGAGGMGEVWKAEQTSPVRRTGFRQRGRKQELLVVQDEHARLKLHWRLVDGPARAEDVHAYLESAFARHGAPLVLKHDGDAIFHEPRVSMNRPGIPGGSFP